MKTEAKLLPFEIHCGINMRENTWNVSKLLTCRLILDLVQLQTRLDDFRRRL